MTIAIVTLLYDTSYLPGALLLGSILNDMISNLSASQPHIKLGVITDKRLFNQHQLNLLLSIFEIIEKPLIKTLQTSKLENDLKRPELDLTFSKVHLWGLPFDKVLYLDADTLPNPDSNLLDLLQLEFAEAKILAAPDSGFPDVFNSGMFVMKPNSTDYENLVDLATSGNEVSFDGADQGLLNQYFNTDPDWVIKVVDSGSPAVSAADTGSNWIKLPFLYNVTPNSQYQYEPAYNYFSGNLVHPFGTQSISPPLPNNSTSLNHTGDKLTIENYGNTANTHFSKQVKLIHYIGPHKPWTYAYNASHLEWWSLWHKYFSNTSLSTIHGTVEDTSYTTQDSLWNAGANSPPKASSNTSFGDIPKYESAWDSGRSTPKKHKSILKPSGSRGSPGPSRLVSLVTPPELESTKHQRELEREKQSVYGYHPFQKPERLFDQSYDYVPSHPFISKAQAKKSPSFSNSLNADEINKKLEKLELDN